MSHLHMDWTAMVHKTRMQFAKYGDIGGFFMSGARKNISAFISKL